MNEWHLPAWLLNSTVVVAGLSLAGFIIRQIGPWRKQISDLEERLRTELTVNHAKCEAELRIIRHRQHGDRGMVYALLHLFDMPEERRGVALDAIRARLAAMEQAEATETGIVVAAGIGG